MYTTQTYLAVKAQVSTMLAEQPGLLTSEMARLLSLSEAEVTLALPDSMITPVAGTQAESLLARLPDWGPMTTIIQVAGSIFEVKAPFAKGKSAHGYYNLNGGKAGQLHGHLKLDLITNIALVSKPFRGTESHYIGFYDAEGECVFKVYLGRDKRRQLISAQVEMFTRLREEYR